MGSSPRRREETVPTSKHEFRSPLAGSFARWTVAGLPIQRVWARRSLCEEIPGPWRKNADFWQRRDFPGLGKKQTGTFLSQRGQADGGQHLHEGSLHCRESACFVRESCMGVAVRAELRRDAGREANHCRGAERGNNFEPDARRAELEGGTRRAHGDAGAVKHFCARHARELLPGDQKRERLAKAMIRPGRRFGPSAGIAREVMEATQSSCGTLFWCTEYTLGQTNNA